MDFWNRLSKSDPGIEQAHRPLLDARQTDAGCILLARIYI